MNTLSKSHNKRILIADDEPSLAQILSLFLTSQGFQVNTSMLAQVNDNYIIDAKIDLIIVDINPDLTDGFRLCRDIKQSGKTKDIPLIVIIDQTFSFDHHRQTHQADDVLLKPFNPQELSEHIKQLLNYQSSIKGHDFQVDIIRELTWIINGRHLEPYFQPIYLLDTMSLFGLEVLSRPQTSGVLSNPEELFVQALRHGVYHELEMIGWSKALSVLKQKNYLGHIFLNCSPFLIEDDRFYMASALFDKDRLSRHVYLEITERSSINEQELFYQRLDNCRQQGFKIAIDDVGAGYASLESIVNTRPDVVKIDRHITNNISQDSFKKSIVKLIVTFCHENNIISVAEGIETKEDLETVISLGVDAGQGYYLCRPTNNLDIQALSNFKF